MKEMTHLSLFSGIGGLDLAAEWAGFETVGQCEWADYPTKVLEKHWPYVPRWRDIHGLSADDVFRKAGTSEITVVSGGFPCQPHSVAGKRGASHDERDLWPEFMRVVREVDPRWIVGENVPGLLTSENGKFFGRILRDLAEWGADVWWYSFPAHAVGAPFWGQRVAIVAASPRVGRGNVDQKQKGRPDAEHLEDVGAWKARQAGLPPHMERPVSLPERRGPRNDDGLPEGMDRIKCLGNSVVPQQFYPIFEAIAEVEKMSASICGEFKRRQGQRRRK